MTGVLSDSRGEPENISGMVFLLRLLSSPTARSEAQEVTLWCQLATVLLDEPFWGDIASLGEFKVLSRDHCCPKQAQI
jgi:hypothetical protein